MQADSSDDEDEMFNTRINTESCILAAFKHNIQLNSKGLLNKFAHVISVDRLQQLIAREFIEKDLLKMRDS